MEIVAAEIELCARWSEPYLDFRVLPVKLAEPRQQPALQEFVRHAQVEHAADPFAPDAFDRAPQFVETAPHAGQKFGAFLGQCDRTGMPPEQRHADVGLERLDLGADGCGRDAEFACRRSEAQVGRNGVEDAQGVEWDALGGRRHGLALSETMVNNTDASHCNQGIRPTAVEGI